MTSSQRQTWRSLHNPRHRPVPLLFLGTLLSCLWLSRPLSAQPVHFRETAADWGLLFRHHHGGSGRRFMQETTAGGLILFDFDDDGDTDVLFVDGGHLPGYDGEPARTSLFRNESNGSFADVTDRSGIVMASYGFGGTAGDIDGDGDADLYLTAYASNYLFRNNGDGTFTDITATSATGGDQYSASAAFADTDRDGDLDLYVVNYLDYPIENPKVCRDATKDIVAFCHPTLFPGAHDRFYRNRGDGTFDDATETSGLGAANGNGLGLAFADFDNDRWPDLYVANDSTPNFLFRNLGDGTFEDQSLLSGTAFGDRVVPEAGMGVAVGDVDGNGFLDLFVTNYALETNALYRNFGSGLFADARHLYGIAEPSIPMLGFGATFADFDHDGALDLAIANGHIQDNIEIMHPGLTYRQRNQILLNDGAGRFAECLDCGLQLERVSRALATGDLDRDGDLDLVIVNADDVAEVYENQSGSTTGAWLQLDLVGAPGPAGSIGARLTLTAAGRQQSREVHTASSFQSQSALTTHFGLATASTVETLQIDWPNGSSQQLRGLKAGNRYSRIQSLLSTGIAEKR